MKENILSRNLFYIGIILTICGLIMIFGGSYAYFIKKVNDTDITIETGITEYVLESNELDSNKIITLNEGETIKFKAIIKSNVKIASKYQMYYKSDSDLTDVVIGYLTSSIDLPNGDITTGEEKYVTVIVQNNSSNTITITIGVRGELVNGGIEDIILKNGEVRLNQSIDDIY